MMDSIKKGILYGVFSYAFWGIMPVYWHLLDFTGPLRILGCRITFALIFTVLVLFILKNKTWVTLLSNPAKRRFTIFSGLVVSINWGAYIWAVNTGHTIEASLGYYINPLISVLLALIFLRERLGIIQWAAFGLATAGVLMVTIFSGVFPWISLILAISFGVYGLLKKKNSAGSLEALGAETLAILPLGLVLLIFPAEGLSHIAPLQWLLLLSAGIVTALPLYTFAQGAKLLPLAALGFLQFINPTILFFLGVFAFGEKFSPKMLWAFSCIWLAVGLYCFSLRKSKTF